MVSLDVLFSQPEELLKIRLTSCRALTMSYTNQSEQLVQSEAQSRTLPGCLCTNHAHNLKQFMRIVNTNLQHLKAHW